MTTLVGLDVGTTGVKAVAISPDGEVLATAEEGYPLSTPQPGWAEQDPRTGGAPRRRRSRGSPVATRRLGLSGQMHGLVCLDEDDRVLRPAILWNDQRTAAECAEIEERVGLERLIELTGNRALTGFTAPKLLWLRRHEPEVYARIRRILLPKDYVRLRLTGEHGIDVADASGTLLFDVARTALDATTCSRRSRSRTNGCRPSPSRPCYGGAGDQQAAALGVGVDRPGTLSVVLGTSGVVFAALPGYRADPEARVHVFCHAVPGTWQAMGVMLSAAGSAALVPRRARARRPLRRARRRGRAMAARRGGADLPALPRRRADASRRPVRAGRVRRVCRSGTTAGPSSVPCSRASPTACATRSSCCANSASMRRSAGLRRRRAQRPLARDRRLGARCPARADRGRGGIRLRRGAARGRRGRRVRERGGGRRALRPGA